MNNIVKNITAILIVVAVCCSLSITTSADTKQRAESTTVVQTTKKKSTTTKKTFKPYKRYIKHNKTRVRVKPNKKSKIVKRLSLGKKVTIKEKHGNWLRVGKNKWVHKGHLSKKDPTPRYQGVKLQYSARYNITSNRLTRSKGVNHYNGYRETWYSSKEYGQSRTAYSIPGKHLAEDGTYRDKDGYICVAASRSYAKGTRFMTSLGPAKVYDRGVSGNTIDIYTNW